MKYINSIRLQNIIAETLGWASHKPGAPRILTFHSIKDSPDANLHQAPKLFEAQIRYLAENDYKSLHVSDIVTNWPSILLADKIVVLTFDDGMENFRTIVCPILKHYGMTATFFIPTAYVGEVREYPRNKELSDYYSDSYMVSWQDLLEIRDQGYEVGAHSHTHKKISQLPMDDAKNEIIISKTILEERLGCSINSFAYPFGRSDAFAAWTRKLLAEAGYSAACTMMSKSLDESDDLLQLPRTGINGFDTLKHFILKLEGNYDCIRWIWNK